MIPGGMYPPPMLFPMGPPPPHAHGGNGSGSPPGVPPAMFFPGAPPMPPMMAPFMAAMMQPAGMVDPNAVAAMGVMPGMAPVVMADSFPSLPTHREDSSTGMTSAVVVVEGATDEVLKVEMEGQQQQQTMAPVAVV